MFPKNSLFSTEETEETKAMPHLKSVAEIQEEHARQHKATNKTAIVHVAVLEEWATELDLAADETEFGSTGALILQNVADSIRSYLPG